MPRSVARLLSSLLPALVAGCDIGGPARVEAPADSAAGETGFRLAGPGGAAVLVPVFINGRGPYQLVLDTGATLTCVDERLAADLGLKRATGAIGVGATVGGAGRVRLLHVDSLRVGAARVEALTVCSLDLGHIAALSPDVRGLLGLNVLRRFRVTLDFERNVVRLAPPGTGA